MDISLERILSLIPKKPDGRYVHGAKKQFCEVIGAPGNIINEWERGASKSYRHYLYAVAAKYDVSVEWLKGESDDMGGTGKPRDKKASALAGAAGVAAGIVGATVLPGAAAIAAIDTAGAAFLSGKKKKPAPDTGDELKRAGYNELNAENRALIDQMIEKLLKSQSDE